MESSTRLSTLASRTPDGVSGQAVDILPDARQVEVDRALGAVDAGHGSIVWTGEYGMGRSTLLDAIGERIRRGGVAADVMVARLTVESRTTGRGGPQGAIGDLVAFQVEGAPGEPHDGIARTLTRVLSGAEPDRDGRDSTTLQSLVGDRTLVLVVDDLEDSAPAVLNRLLLMARSESHRRVLLATSVCSPFGQRPPHDVDVRQLPPLTTEAALLVLASAGCLPVAPHVARRLVDKLNGNPACLIQTARVLSGEQLAGTSLLPDPLPVVPAVRGALAPQLEGLTARDRGVLLAAAVTVVDRLDILTAATGVSIVALTQGKLADQLDPIAGRFAFADPRLRALIHGDASLAERTTAHVALASTHRAAGDQEIAAWHTALATLVGDSAVVPKLLSLAHRHLDRGDTEWAHAVAREAVGHATGDERLRACELSGLAAVLSGHIHDAAHWLPHAARSGDLTSRARTLLGLTMTLTLTEGRVPDDLLERTRAEAARLEGTSEADQRTVTEVARGLTVAACLHFERGNIDTARDRLAEAAALVGVEERCAHEGTSLARAWLAMYGDEFAAEVDLPEHTRLVDDEALGAVARAVTLMHRDESSAAARVLASAVAELAPLRHGGRWFDGADRAVSPLVEAHLRVVQALVEMRAGDVARAAMTLRDAAAKLPVGMVFAGLGVTLSRRLDTVRDGRIGVTSTALAATSPCAAGAPMRLGMLVDRALAASFREEHVQAATLLELAAERETRERGVVMAVPGLDAVETWSMAGRPDEARRALDRLQVSLTALSPAVRDASLARALLALATKTDVAQLASRATLAGRRLESAYERGKVELSIGRAMARLEIRESALAHLMAAQDLFEESGAQAWVALVGLEGERAGRGASDRASIPQAGSARADATRTSSSERVTAPVEVEPSHHDDWAAELTERELEVALLVAQGLANREVAARLFCSVRTVEVHLGRVYRKLDLRSRFELVVLAHTPDSSM
ncbi:helix-turn-helix transcriptional regulator [Demequina aurantiaca]|uniref:helix-turn-helix transcriptional regulator n=1 Tax=Demequina aurantiaca TaxID=676200 RepID=UPI0007857421|nr:LuxR C-terminal-related transcriptional regulator [Demequina aurantiaca]